MDIGLCFPSRFVKAVDLKGKDATLTITGVTLEELAQVNGVSKTKGLVAFAESKKLLVLNRTNAECIKGMFGRETDAWIGKRVTLWPAPFNSPFGDDSGVAIRVRGSPDISSDMQVEIRLPRKSPITVTMKRTGAKPKGNAKPTPPAPKPSAPELPLEPGASEVDGL